MIDIHAKKLIIFDLDGTIAKLGVDWETCRKEVKKILLEKYPELAEAFLQKEVDLKNKGKELTVEIMSIIAYDFLVRDVYTDFQYTQEHYETAYNLNKLKIYSNIVRFINKDRKILYAICSNNSMVGISYALDFIGLTDKFVAIESRQVGRPPKPYKNIIDDLFKKNDINDIKIHDCLFVGDNEHTDKKLAESYNIDYLHRDDFIKFLR